MLLSPLGWVYGKIADIRNTLYERGVLKSYDLGARTISIGNVTTGGTGKTPLVAYVAEILADAGEKVCILTRGYGRQSSGRVLVSDGATVLVDARTGGDEPVELARKLIGKAIVVADADRVEAAAWAKETFGITAFVLDDGFQHRRAKRDLDIVCIDATNPFGNGGIVPGGILRESLSNLNRADVFVITRSNLVSSTDEIIEKLGQENSLTTIFESTFELRRVAKLDDPRSDIADRSRTFVFCAVGNPESFVSQIELEGFEVAGFRSFADHHDYSQNDIDQVEIDARSKNAISLITTAKDAVKLEGLKFELPCYIAEGEVIINDSDRFRDLVLSA
ncbi:MAG: tetraacyldisaccharide 4'-kinase [Acidobacteria bacterium]|nr:MAG: tetraacyldisaccharide 4'-kinase [Acidobacteriota bacterium]